MAVVAVIVVVAGAFALTDGFHAAPKSSTTDLVPADSYYSIPAYQYNDIEFVAHSSSRINGTLTNTLGLIIYILTVSQMRALNHNGTVGTYNWTSGLIPHLTVYGLDLVVQTGEWNLVFLNPNTVAANTTVVGFYSAVTLGPA